MQATTATSPHWALLLATCSLCLSAVTALAAGPVAAAPGACPDMDPVVKKRPLIDINTASALDLRCGLEGVNDALAKKIIDNRDYTKVEDLLDMKVLNSGTFQNNQSRLTVSNPGGAGKPAAKSK